MSRSEAWWTTSSEANALLWHAITSRVPLSTLTLATGAIARLALVHAGGDARPRQAIEAAEAWARGETSPKAAHLAAIHAFGASNAPPLQTAVAVAAMHVARMPIARVTDLPLMVLGHVSVAIWLGASRHARSSLGDATHAAAHAETYRRVAGLVRAHVPWSALGESQRR